MKILAVGFDLSQSDREQIGRVVAACGFTSQNLDTRDIKTTAIDFIDIDLVLIFGERAGRSIVPMAKEKGLLYTLLPTIKNLYPTEYGGIAEDRARTFKELSTIAEALRSGQIQVVSDRKLLSTIKPPAVIADLSIPVIQTLEKTIRDSGRTSWTCTTKDGKVVGIIVDAQTPEPPGVDYCITFAELLAMRAAIDVLQIQEIKFVSSSKLQTNQNSQTIGSNGSRDPDHRGDRVAQKAN